MLAFFFFFFFLGGGGGGGGGYGWCILPIAIYRYRLLEQGQGTVQVGDVFCSEFVRFTYFEMI